MQSQPKKIAILLPVVLIGALVAGYWAGQCYQDREPQETAGFDGLPPLPEWAAAPLPDFAGYTDTDKKKDAFFSFLFPRIALANDRILTLREHLHALSDKLANQEELSPEDKRFLRAQAERLRVEAPLGSPEMFELLSRRLDIVPPSLVLAQAANESGWGTSRFARQGNNLFGQWCFSPGCGMVPQGRASGASHEVASFHSPYQSLRSYMTNLNRHPSYKALRDGRAALRAEDQFPDGGTLAQGLDAYSERGAEYVDEIQAMIRYNELQRYDRLFNRWAETDTGGDAPYGMLRPQRQASAAVE